MPRARRPRIAARRNEVVRQHRTSARNSIKPGKKALTRHQTRLKSMNDTPSRLPLNRTVILLLLIALALVWFVPLGWRHLLPSDEGRYAEMAREMFVTGDWITPRYNGYKYFEKPPLQTWANALTFAWLGSANGRRASLRPCAASRGEGWWGLQG